MSEGESGRAGMRRTFFNLQEATNGNDVAYTNSMSCTSPLQALGKVPRQGRSSRETNGNLPLLENT